MTLCGGGSHPLHTGWGGGVGRRRRGRDCFLLERRARTGQREPSRTRAATRRQLGTVRWNGNPKPALATTLILDKLSSNSLFRRACDMTEKVPVVVTIWHSLIFSQIRRSLAIRTEVSTYATHMYKITYRWNRQRKIYLFVFDTWDLVSSHKKLHALTLVHIENNEVSILLESK